MGQEPANNFPPNTLCNLTRLSVRESVHRVRLGDMPQRGEVLVCVVFELATLYPKPPPDFQAQPKQPVQEGTKPQTGVEATGEATATQPAAASEMPSAML